MTSASPDSHWYALKVFYNRTASVSNAFAALGSETYIPMRRTETESDGRRIVRHTPAVSSLLFVRTSESRLFDLQRRLRSTAPFMPYFDRAERRPAPIPDDEMERFIRLTRIDAPGIEYLPEDPAGFRRGDLVRVTGGPFEGAEGYIRRIRGDRRLVVAIEGVMVVATAHIPGHLLQKIEIPK